ncbi:MAG: hypothetical protein IOC56_02145 [Methylobacterium sp.]|nr:hypothetical protein [Methylobacterium sp.]MCA3619876.1 hypothetical protein [Methylobacterium sp.]
MAFTSLRVWRDLDQDGVSDAGELFSLADLGIASINANGSALNVVSPSGVTLRERSTFRTNRHSRFSFCVRRDSWGSRFADLEPADVETEALRTDRRSMAAD